MAKCKKCGKGGFFRKLNSSGLCPCCEEIDAFEGYKLNDWSTYQNHKQQDVLCHEQAMASTKAELNDYENRLKDSKATYEQLRESAKADAFNDIQQILQQMEERKNFLQEESEDLRKKVECLTEQEKTQEKSLSSAANRLIKVKEIIKSLQYVAAKYSCADTNDYIDDEGLLQEAEKFLFPTVELKLQCMNVRQLRKEYTRNQRLIKELLAKYKARYTTKANQAIYRLMVIALEAELQNVLYNIGYGRLDKATGDVKEITDKYQKIASDGNQNIAPTIQKFIGELEYFFIRAVEIEYEYYVQKERIKEEQRAIREQMRQESVERKELERQRKHIEKEESKYNAEINSVQELLLLERDAEKVRQLEERIARLQEQLKSVDEKKEEILRLETGKAGNVYVISNLGSFGDAVFKIGMTRRLDPMERVRELGDASVPFPYDVHSFIFSEDAVGLESSMHKRLNDKRLNKVNLRREFFATSIDELEDMVYELEPTAEFNRTMLAEQYYQSLSISDVPEHFEFIDDEEIDGDEMEEVIS